MIESNRSYYRNWYQHWQLEKEKEEKLQAMKYFSEKEQTIQLDEYRANHEINRQYTYGGSKRHYAHIGQKISHQKINSRANNRKSNGEIFRGLLIGLPAVVVVLTLLYSVGVIPQDVVDRLLIGNEATAVMTYIGQHGEVMILHNEINHSLEKTIANQSISGEFQQELQVKHQLVQEQTELLMGDYDIDISNLNRLWQLKLTSLNEMVTYLLANEEITSETVTYYDQFVEDQNEIGEQISLALSQLLEEHHINYVQQMNGNIELVN